MTTPLPLVLALTGASGAPYGVRLLEILARNRIPVWLITSEHGMRLLQEECAIGSLDALRQATGGDWSSVVSYPDGDRGALPADSWWSPERPASTSRAMGVVVRRAPPPLTVGGRAT